MTRVNTIYDFADNAIIAPANPSRLWTGSVVSLALLLCVGLAFCQDGRKNLVTFDKYQIYEINKSVADFQEYDVSSPEAAYATLNKISASRDKDVLAQWEKYCTHKLKISDMDFYFNLSDEWVEIMKTAEILKVCTYADQAIVIAKLVGKETRNPYDIRWLRKIGDQWLNEGNDRVDSPDVALLKFARLMERNPGPAVAPLDFEDVTSLEKFLNIEGLKRYPVNKRIADFPADKIDLSSPEAAYATQKNLIVSNYPDKLERILSITVGRPNVSDVPAHERRMNDEKITEEWAKTYREQFVVYEVFVVNDKYAFVFGLRQYDDLFDGNYFVKEGDEWLNNGNDQDKNAENLAGRVQRGLSRYARVNEKSAAASTIRVIPLQNADASKVQDTLTSLIPSDSRQGGDFTPLRFATDERSNSIILVGALDDLNTVEAIIFNLDKDNSETSPATVEGIITVEELPLAGATVMFTSVTGTKETYAGITNAEGKYTLRSQSAENMNEIQPGQYKVTIDKKVLKDGEVQSVVNPIYTHIVVTPFQATVEKGKNQFDFVIPLK